MMWLTGLTIIVGVGQIYMIYRQAQIAERQNAIMESQSSILNGQAAAARQQAEYMRDGLIATTKAADAAKKSADTATDALHVSQRACLNIVDIGFNNFGPGLSPGIIYKISNTGHLPAALLEQSAYLLTDEKEFPAVGLDGVPDHEPWHPLSTVIPPTGSSPFPGHVSDTFGPGVVFSEGDWQRIQAGTFLLKIYGALRYSAGFNYIGEVGFAAVYVPARTDQPLHRRFVMANEPGYQYSIYRKSEKG